MKYLPLSNVNAPVMVDDDDYERLKGFNWHFGKNGYVFRNVKIDGKWTTRTLHRDVLSVEKGMDVEHADRNRLNNQKTNLRAATRSQNMANVHRAKKDKAYSQYKGVSRLNRPKLKNQWLAYVKVDYKMHYLGYFETEGEAAHMYNQFAEQIFGEFAHLNDIA